MPYTRMSILPRPELTSTLPDADKDVLTRLSDISQVRAWAHRRAAEYKDHVSTIRAIYNTIAPISTLPTEILQEVFVHVPCMEMWCDALWLLSLGLVCRRWHSVLLATPEYWARSLHTVMERSYYEYYRSYDRSDHTGGHDISQGRALFLARSAPWPLEVLLEYSKDGPGWDVFEDHFDRVTAFEAAARDADELDDILNAVTSSMKRLRSLRITADYRKLSPLLFDWEADDLPHLGYLTITSGLFCRVTTVPSLHTVILTAPPRDISSLPQLFDALEQCPALATLRLELTHKDDTLQNRALKRVLNLPALRTLAVGGGVSDVRCFLTALTFPSTTFVELDVLDTGGQQDRGLVLPNILRKRSSADHAHHWIFDGVDRLCFYSNHEARYGNDRMTVSMQAYVQGAQRLRITPAFWFQSTGSFLEIITLFRECGVAELALDLRYTPRDMDERFWTKFFAALPDLRRLELLSPTAKLSRATKRDIASHYLASLRVSQRAPESDPVRHGFSHGATPLRRAVSLAWVLHVTDERDPSLQLEAELSDVEQLLSGHARGGSRVDRVELYATGSYGTQALDVTHIETHCSASRLVARDYAPRLEAVADVVVVGGGWGVAELDELHEEEDDCGNESGCEDTDSEEESEQ